MWDDCCAHCWRIVRELQRLELVLNMIKTIEAERDAIVSAGKSSMHANAKKIQDLIRLKSIGPEIGTALVGEVFYRQFNNRQQLGSYVGLTPSHFQSGPMSRDQGISKAGNPKARTVMIELAWLWLRHQPNSPLSIWFRERVGTAKGRIRRIARCYGTQAFDHLVAIPRNRRGADGHRSERL